jgi:serine/threonine protein kinase
MTLRIAPIAGSPTKAGRALAALARLEHYEIECVIALSAFAAVYRAYDPAARQVVAIKEYLPEALALRSANGWVTPIAQAHRERFELGRTAFVNEALSLARVDHPSLVRVLHLFEAKGTAYRVMRFAPGPTLLQYRNALGAPPAVEDFTIWLEGLLGALSVLHAAHCTHGSVTPANILLRPGERPLLLDFEAVRKSLVGGPATNATSTALSHQVPTGPSWPVATGPPGPASDLYALAVTLHYGISGELPATPAPGRASTRFEPLAHCWQRLHGSLPIPPGLKKAFDALDTCLAGEPRHRPQTVSEFRDWLSGKDLDGLPAVAARRAAAREDDDHEVSGNCAPSDPVTETETASAIERDTEAVLRGPTSIVRLGFGDPIDTAEEAAGEPASIGPERTTRAGVEPEPVQEVVVAVGPTNSSSTAAGGRVAWWAGLALTASVGAGAWWWDRSAAPPPAPLVAAQDDAPSIVRRDAAEAPTPAPTSDALPSVAPPTAAPASGVVTRPPPRPAARPPTTVAARPASTDPRQACGERSGFALYQCMQLQCAKAAWTKHDQCVQFRHSDAVD